MSLKNNPLFASTTKLSQRFEHHETPEIEELLDIADHALKLAVELLMTDGEHQDGFYIENTACHALTLSRQALKRSEKRKMKTAV